MQKTVYFICKTGYNVYNDCFKGSSDLKVLNDYDRLIDSVKKIHIIGIGGSGMSPLAEILHSKGYILTGSDNNSSYTLDRIKSLGIPVFMGHAAENIGDAELVIYSAAIMKDNVELVEAEKRGIPTLERSYLLGALTRKFDNVIGVCGTHGKTTVTSMITQILMEAELDPSAVIGGKLPALDSNCRVGESQLMVCEACEYVDTFLKMSPDIAVLLNVDDDHMEYFKTMDRLVESFSKFVCSATKAAIINGDDELAVKAARASKSEVITFGYGEGNDYKAANIEFVNGAFGQFDLVKGSEVLCNITLNVPGKHNILNAVAAAVAALYAGADTHSVVDGLKKFGGAKRRFEILYNQNGITIADDYAHHPSELKVTLQTAKSLNYKRVIAVFQPFTYSRTAMLIDDFADVLSIADKVVLSEIMGSREINTYNIYSADLAKKIDGCVWFDTFEEIAAHIADNVRQGDLVITLGCGDIYKSAKMMIEKLESR